MIIENSVALCAVETAFYLFRCSRAPSGRACVQGISAVGRIRIWPPYITHINIEYGRAGLITIPTAHNITYYILFYCNGMGENDSVPETRDWNW